MSEQKWISFSWGAIFVFVFNIVVAAVAVVVLMLVFLMLLILLCWCWCFWCCCCCCADVGVSDVVAVVVLKLVLFLQLLLLLLLFLVLWTQKFVPDVIRSTMVCRSSCLDSLRWSWHQWTKTPLSRWTTRFHRNRWLVTLCEQPSRRRGRWRRRWRQRRRRRVQKTNSTFLRQLFFYSVGVTVFAFLCK